MGKLTKHGVKRFKQRVNTEQNISVAYKKALREGLNKEDFTGEFYQYLLEKTHSGKRLKIFKDKIYVSTRNSKKFVTVFDIPSKYIPIDQYMITENKKEILYYPEYYINKDVSIKLENDIIIKGILDKVEYEENISQKFIVKLHSEDVLIEVEAKDIDNIIIDTDYLNEELYSMMFENV